MKTIILGLLLGSCLLMTGCGGKDYLSVRHASEAVDSIEKLLPDSKLPDSAKAAIKEQAAEWKRYEESK